MASSPQPKRCEINDKCEIPASLECIGCKKSFCNEHIMDHRRSFDKEMDDIMNKLNQIKKDLDPQTNKADHLTLEKEIKKWKNDSIAKIKKQANELQDKLRQSFDAPKTDMLSRIQKLSDELKKLRETNNFVEQDIDKWKKTLKDLETYVTWSAKVRVARHDNDSLVGTLSVDVFKIETEVFNKVSNDSVRLEQDGQVAVHNHPDLCTEIRGKTEYKKGCHEIYLRIEEISTSWMFLGINSSKSTPLQNDSYTSKSTYGWSNDNCVWEKGAYKSNQSARIDMNKNDLISLVLDCDNRRIEIHNKRMSAKHEMKVDDLQCPLPWQIHVNLCEPNSRVRLLSNDFVVDKS
jgi:hypothetical protein